MAALAAMAMSACGDEPAPPIGLEEGTIAISDLPVAYRTPQAMIQAMATGQLYERPALCDGFAAQDAETGKQATNWSAFAKIADARAGKAPAAVLTQAVDFDPAAGRVAFISTPVGSDGQAFRSEWTLRVDEAGDRIDCVRRVIIENAS